jgi:hypothetical protein
MTTKPTATFRINRNNFGSKGTVDLRAISLTLEPTFEPIQPIEAIRHVELIIEDCEFDAEGFELMVVDGVLRIAFRKLAIRDRLL